MASMPNKFRCWVRQVRAKVDGTLVLFVLQVRLPVGSQLEKYAQSHHLYEGFLLLIARSPSASEWGWAENFHGLCWESHREGGGCFSAFGC